MQIRNGLALVTGASSGIGRACAELLASKGARVILLARREAELLEAATAIRERGGEAWYYSVDLSNPEEVESLADRIRSDIGVPDMIVNSAGAGKWLPLVETSLAEARTMIELPYLAAFYVTRLFLPEMIRRGSGNVTSVTSPASYLVWPNACGYIASRHALRGFTEALRQEVRHTGVHVSLVTLGTVASPYWAHNPGSREHLPKAIPGLMPELSTAQAAEVVVDAIEHNKARSVRPGFFRFLFFISR